MDDEVEDRVLYQTYLSYMKLLSKIAVGVPCSAHAPFSYIWRLMRVYLLRPEVLILTLLVFVLCIYIQTLGLWSRGLFSRLPFSLEKPKSLRFLGAGLDGDKLSWEIKENVVAAYAVQGRRAKMEDRFVIQEDINSTGVSVYAVFDGHGGEFAANYARDHLMKNLNNKLVDIKNLQAVAEKNDGYLPSEPKDTKPDTKETNNNLTDKEKRSSFKKTVSTTDECVKKGSFNVTDPELLRMLNQKKGPITREVRKSVAEKVESVPLRAYLDGSRVTGINYGRIITDQVLATDRLLVEQAKKTMDVAGTTALIALIDGEELVVANVGDSRAVMCDAKGNAIPLSFDHKPQQIKERNRIKDAGGFISFNGVWRVAGILATSRALGDYPLKDKKLVIPDPDILTFNLTDHRPQFIMLASDGLWDTFSNEEAVSFIKERLNEPHFGAKSITLQAYYRGSLDNITVIVINLKNMTFSSFSGSKST